MNWIRAKYGETGEETDMHADMCRKGRRFVYTGPVGSVVSASSIGVPVSIPLGCKTRVAGVGRHGKADSTHQYITKPSQAIHN